ncbi:zinc finger protein 43-like [Lutzomyia longipalpis]|uniref:zinc finger protein 43-like n=1 Tax=Lutzomyia longipalpis TaxID=7200 RepID=UPI002483ED5C|nr:zinc finger protein 43-like [Lutzomyia longipalpis]
MEFIENPQVWCSFVNLVYTRITDIYNDILHHQNQSPECEICPKNRKTISFIKDHLFLIVRINLQPEEEEQGTGVDVTAQRKKESEKFKEELVDCNKENEESFTESANYIFPEHYMFDHESNIDEEINNTPNDKQDNIKQVVVNCSESVNETDDEKQKCDTTDKLYECALCHVKVSQKCNLAQHMIWHLRKVYPKRRSKDEKFFPKWKKLGKKKCPLCKGIYKEKHECKELGQQTRTKYSCTYCPEIFTTYRKIYIHHKANHLDKPKPVSPYQCEICGASAIRLHTLKRHMMFHTDNYPFECDLCKKKFRTSQKMKEHRETHLPKDERNIRNKCKICGKQCYSSTTLKTHISLRHKERETFKCNICGREFLKDLSLKRHLPVHDGETGRHHKCDICGMIFKSFRYMKQHRKRKHELIDEMIEEKSAII